MVSYVQAVLRSYVDNKLTKGRGKGEIALKLEVLEEEVRLRSQHGLTAEHAIRVRVLGTTRPLPPSRFTYHPSPFWSTTCFPLDPSDLVSLHSGRITNHTISNIGIPTVRSHIVAPLSQFRFDALGKNTSGTAVAAASSSRSLPRGRGSAATGL